MPNNPPLLHVMIRSREKILIDQDIKALSSVNETGEFDILQEHTNFISIINKYIKLYMGNGTIQEIPLTQQAVLKMDAGVIHIFLGLLSVTNTVTSIKPPK